MTRPSLWTTGGTQYAMHCSKCGVYMSHDFQQNPAAVCDLCEYPPVLAKLSRPPTNEELIALALTNGFTTEDSGGLSGFSELDREVYVGEYACGHAVIRFARALLASIQQETGK